MARTAAGGTNRITVPARPQSISAGPLNPSCGPTVIMVPSTSIGTPSARSAATIRSLSRLRRAPVSEPPSGQSAASSNARLVIDLDPGTVTEASTGPVAVGAGHAFVMVR